MTLNIETCRLSAHEYYRPQGVSSIKYMIIIKIIDEPQPPLTSAVPSQRINSNGKEIIICTQIIYIIKWAHHLCYRPSWTSNAVHGRDKQKQEEWIERKDLNGEKKPY